jgi:hypothetical protein
MAKVDKLLAQMRANPRDWRISDVQAVCSGFDIVCTPPRNGSHYKVKHPLMNLILTIPMNRPIKPVYIRLLVQFIDAVKGESA